MYGKPSIDSMERRLCLFVQLDASDRLLRVGDGMIIRSFVDCALFLPSVCC